MPTTTNLTEKILLGDGVIRRTDGRYILSNSNLRDDDRIDHVKKVIRSLKLKADSFYSIHGERDINYEDVYSLARQIYESEFGNYENPAIQLFVEDIANQLCYSTVGQVSSDNNNVALMDIARETVNYITGIVANMLSKVPANLKYLSWVKDAIMDDSSLTIHIFTLNHDLVLETFFDEDSVEFIDGFTEEQNGVRYWEPGLFSRNSNIKTKLFKIHGSINFYRLLSDTNSSKNSSIVIPSNERIYRNGALNPHPMLLVGTLNKLLQYSEWFYVDLYCLLHAHLNMSNRLIISGYSFGDKAINNEVLGWLNNSPDSKAIVIHPDPNKLSEGARLAVKMNLAKFVELDKVRLLKKNFEDVTWQELKAKL